MQKYITKNALLVFTLLKVMASIVKVKKQRNTCFENIIDIVVAYKHTVFRQILLFMREQVDEHIYFLISLIVKNKSKNFSFYDGVHKLIFRYFYCSQAN